jgi:hypothetical protein
MAIHPDRGYNRGGHTRTAGDAIFVDLGGGKNLVALLAHIDKTLDPTARTTWRCGLHCARRQASLVQRDEPADRYRAGHGRVDPGAGELADPANPGTARAVPSDDGERVGARLWLQGSPRRSCRTVTGH